MIKSYELRTSPLTRKQQAYLNRAAKLAQASQVRQRHGAIVVKGGSVLSLGVNSYTNDPNMFPIDYLNSEKIPHSARGKLISVHAEVAAMRRVSPQQLKGAIVYVARVSKTGLTGNSAPCSHCTQQLLAAGVKKVIFTE